MDVYVGIAITVAAFVQQLAAGIYRPIADLRERVAVLESLQKYSHGDLKPFLKE